MIEGAIVTYVNALGTSEGEQRFTDAVALVGDQYKVETYNDRGFEEKYLIQMDRGADFLLKAGALSSVFFYAEGSRDRSPYFGWSSLVDGIGPDASRDDIVRVLGEPYYSTPQAMLYAVDDAFVRFAFEEGTLTMAVAQREAPGVGTASTTSASATATDPDPDAAEALRAEPEAEPEIDGELSAFLNALGKPIHSPEHLALIVLAGPAMEVEEAEQDGAAWEYHRFPKTGVILQFKNELLVGALVRLIADEDESAYPRPERLVTGCALPSSRAQIKEHFGTPHYASEDMDLYLVGERYVQFNYESDQTVDVTVLMPGVGV
ncbi:hypothetical protein DC31_03970 [Microbacterium sp. CH12i]|uniref:hypothetical protein n=1 Tax=Microbacterium sp. CH12i TaxID=1479651 RepID=UPI000460D48D|nr:hypothetical protein [Microbacterium sp. CH12i]KDA05261.1 hypothetical protein DC31_03970 [Microbacterium sp. CH12i]